MLNLPNKPTQPNLLNLPYETYQPKPTNRNLLNQTTKTNLSNQKYKTNQTKLTHTKRSKVAQLQQQNQIHQLVWKLKTIFFKERTDQIKADKSKLGLSLAQLSLSLFFQTNCCNLMIAADDLMIAADDLAVFL